jgi:hypothetical protein
MVKACTRLEELARKNSDSKEVNELIEVLENDFPEAKAELEKYVKEARK